MDHGYIDGHRLAERYLDHALRPQERTAFEAHMVDCPECVDRLLLAEMFHARNGFPTAVRPVRAFPAQLPAHAMIVAQFEPWEFVVILTVAGLLLLAVPTVFLRSWGNSGSPPAIEHQMVQDGAIVASTETSFCGSSKDALEEMTKWAIRGDAEKGVSVMIGTRSVFLDQGEVVKVLERTPTATKVRILKSGNECWVLSEAVK